MDNTYNSPPPPPPSYPYNVPYGYAYLPHPNSYPPPAPNAYPPPSSAYPSPGPSGRPPVPPSSYSQPSSAHNSPPQNAYPPPNPGQNHHPQNAFPSPPPPPPPFLYPFYPYPSHFMPIGPITVPNHGSMEYHQRSAPPSSHSGPLPYPHGYLPSFQPLPYGSYPYGYYHPPPDPYPPPESISNSSSVELESTLNKDVVNNSSLSRPLLTPSPRVDDRLGNLQLSEDASTTTASSSEPLVQTGEPSEDRPAASSVQLMRSTQTVVRHQKQGSNLVVDNTSLSTGGESTYPGPMKKSIHPAFHPNVINRQCMQIMRLPNKPIPLPVLLLHGNLDIWVYEARNLPNMDMFHKTIDEMFGNVTGSIKNTSDPYVTISVADAVIGRTFVINNDENPVWMQHFFIPVAHYASEVHFVVKDSDVVGSQHIGVVAIPVEPIYSGARVEGYYPILNSNGKICKSGAVLSISIQYLPMDKLHFYQNGVGAGPDYQGVPGTYFPLRKGGKVTLYQDAHVPGGMLPEINLENGRPFVHGQCWRDIYTAMHQARRLIYVTGWSVWDKVKLVRDAGREMDCTLGELLKSKSQEGVRVLLLIWDDPTSTSILGYRTDGVMQTHDEETRRYFKYSSVQVLLCPRAAGKRHSWVKQKEVGTIYTHHQKTVIVDADNGDNRRKVIAFVGGLDICDGRYDTPQHPLFKTLNTVHKDDYHNPSYTGSAHGCPREPWHDLHSKIDGPAAYDVLTNFEERWLKAAKSHGIKKHKMDDALLRIERIPDILGVHDTPSLPEDDPEGWHVQIFRSIDSTSVKGFPKNPREATSRNLVCGKNLLIDMSIQTAYVKAIRAAQHFIYIENQYFIGSSYNWSSHKDLGANNLIPMEIALKIANKIKENERFAAYIVIPMWPEGVPTGNATQRILYWQSKTMQMMYETIFKALEDSGLENAFSPQDFLNFFCLGNREEHDWTDVSAAVPSPRDPNTNNPQSQSRRNRRFMVYVHSKGMIVDDEYVILGSANINQRSMEGIRDTEIAMGAYQPHQTWARKESSPLGKIHGYRMSLWAEHTGTIEECFKEPQSLDCVRRVRAIGEMNWKQFAADEITEMKGHLMKYPVDVDRTGKVKSLPGYETFPDVGGTIVGSFLAIQENLTI